MNEQLKHARLSPSAAHCWMRCPGALLAQKNIPKRTSQYADEGTTAHYLAAETLVSDHRNCEAFLGKVCPDTKMEITQEMCDYIQEYVDDILRLQDGGSLHVEVKVDFSNVVGVPESFGTADVIILNNRGKTLHVHDLKYGRGVAVDARDNEQLMIYALGALNATFDHGAITHVTMGIHMPRKDGYNDWTITVEELHEFGAKVKDAAMLAIGFYNNNDLSVLNSESGVLIPGEKQCRWCDAKAHCPELGEEMVSAATDLKSGIDDVGAKDFEVITEEIEKATSNVADTAVIDINKAARLMALTDLMEGFIKAIRERVIADLEAGNPVPGYKLVRGRGGHRKWDKDDEAEKLLKRMRLKVNEMYSLKLISPTVAEKLLKKTAPKKWAKLVDHIVKPEGSLNVAPESDKRPAVSLPTATDDEFTNLDFNIEDLI